MEMKVKKEQKDNRPYWKVAVSLVLSLLGTALFIFLGIKALLFFMPFVIGWFLSFIASPLVGWLEKKLKIVKKLGSAITVILVLAACVGILYFAVVKIWEEAFAFMNNFPELYQELEKGLREIGKRGSELFGALPEGLQRGWNMMTANLDKTAGEIIGSVSQPTVQAAGNIAKRIPSMLISTIVTIISAYFFTAEREEVILWAKKISPEPLVFRMTMVIDNLKYAVGGYFKAQFKIMGVVFLLLLLGFSVIGVHFSILLAFGVAFLDFLPFLGTGTALFPWAVYKFLTGDYKVGAALFIFYGVTQLVRQLVQPKLVGDSMGLKPLPTLALIYIGYKLGSILGMVFAVPIGMILMNLYKAGAFDYILDDARILAKGALSLRKPEP